MKITLFFEEQRKKSCCLDVFNSYGKMSPYLNEDNFNVNTYINILQEAIHEMRDFTTEENITMQMDNARNHWTKKVL